MLMKYGIHNFYVATITKYEAKSKEQQLYNMTPWGSYSTILLKTKKNGEYIDLEKMSRVNINDSYAPNYVGVTRMEPLVTHLETETDMTKRKALSKGRTCYENYNRDFI